MVQNGILIMEVLPDPFTSGINLVPETVLMWVQKGPQVYSRGTRHLRCNICHCQATINTHWQHIYTVVKSVCSQIQLTSEFHITHFVSYLSQPTGIIKNDSRWKRKFSIFHESLHFGIGDMANIVDKRSNVGQIISENWDHTNTNISNLFINHICICRPWTCAGAWNPSTWKTGPYYFT